MNELKDKLSPEELRKHVEELSKKLLRVNEKLKDAEVMKSNFISNVMNELINPFASILGLSQNIMSLEKGQVDKARSIAKMIYNEAFHLNFQLNNIFAAAKIEAGEIIPDIKNVDLKNLIQSMIGSFGVELVQKDVEVDFHFESDRKQEGITYFKSDPEKIRIILANLLSNAIKFSDPSQTIMFQAEISDKSLTVHIKDQGKGIDEKRLKDIFDRFKQLDTTIHTLNSGYGLGLSIADSLIDLLEGDIQVTSKAGKGSEFTITIPESELSDDDIASDFNEIFFDDDIF